MTGSSGKGRGRSSERNSREQASLPAAHAAASEASSSSSVLRVSALTPFLPGSRPRRPHGPSLLEHRAATPKKTVASCWRRHPELSTAPQHSHSPTIHTRNWPSPRPPLSAHGRGSADLFGAHEQLDHHPSRCFPVSPHGPPPTHNQLLKENPRGLWEPDQPRENRTAAASPSGASRSRSPGAESRASRAQAGVCRAPPRCAPARPEHTRCKPVLTASGQSHGRPVLSGGLLSRSLTTLPFPLPGSGR